jgi:hypothetical protein
MTLLSAQQPSMFAPPEEWEEFVALMDKYAADGDKTAETWAKIGRQRLAALEKKAFGQPSLESKT